MACSPNLAPDLAALDDIAKSLAHSPHPVKAMLLTHYFGFAQDLGPVVAFCAQHHITLIEDCSHALFIPTDHTAPADAARADAANACAPTGGQSLNMGIRTGKGTGMGQTGRYGVASPYKFYASQDGGLLWANAADAPPLARQTPQPLKQQLKGIVHALQSARVNSTQRLARASSAHSPLRGTDTLEDSPATSPYYQPPKNPCNAWPVHAG